MENPLDPNKPEHLIPEVTDRGFMHMPPIPGRSAGEVRVYESSAASGPHIWLKLVDGIDGAQAVTHLPIEDAVLLAEQIMWLAENHYQVRHDTGKEED